MTKENIRNSVRILNLFAVKGSFLTVRQQCFYVYMFSNMDFFTFFLWTHAQRASMLYFADVFYVFFYDSLSWPNG